MQSDYRPDGWLGLILGSKLYYDFGGRFSFKSRMTGLLKAVKAVYSRQEEIDSVDGSLHRVSCVNSGLIIIL